MVKRGRIVAFFLVLVLIASMIGSSTNWITNNMKLGLDLQGGFEVLYEVKSVSGTDIDREMLVSTVSALNKRVNVLGVSEPRIDIEGENRIRVQLAGVEDQTNARELLSTEAKLTFRDINDNLLMDGTDLVENGATQSFDQSNRPSVALKIKDAEKFREITRELSSKLYPENMMVIWLDFEEGVDSFAEERQKDEPKYLSAATVEQVFHQPEVQIQGPTFTVPSAKELADLLNAGALPVELEEIYSTSVGAQFGETALQKTVFAGAVGIAIIFLFMLIVYRVPGFVAVVTLSLYIFLVLVVFNAMNAVLTLPGIAALILGVGMAVDANIITYERIKEELKLGKSMMSAFRSGNRNSLSTILDANITTLLAAAVMFVYGTSSVQGFATMLIVSILMSFLTAVLGTRLLLGLWVHSRALNNKPHLFGLKKEEIMDIKDTKEDTVPPNKFENVDFIKHRKKFFIFSTAMVVIGIALLSTLKLNLGIDFVSGTRVEIMGETTISAEEVQQELASINFEPRDVVLSGANKEIAVARFLDELNQQEIATIKEHLSAKYGSEPNVSTVSPIVGQEISRNAFFAVLIAALGIIIYVTIRFEWIFAASAIIALFHDAFFIIAFFSLVRLEVDLTFIAAVLTIVGYSINDTIVTFDRIRENLKKKKRVKTYEDLAEVVNLSLQQTFTRSINTVVTVLFAVIALLIFGSESITNFSVALLVGLVAGTYSSLFLASQLWLVWKHKQLMRPKKVTPEDDLEPEV
ncbi:protein translocase subunit SecDF [Sutcliffiella sp. NC1]|uniref:protein translocase subunit SecDF n=1 Tax=Sutcliffiella sp. NC1 TaxID=3004096 RepID=UPI0022DDB910|nr:protein translocase subunit SecDF [Sutcliffiella sp. NC1]WBL13953.1 protein translocase subunit SecDF [Sutcliffiella sp. NC1]